MWQLWFLEKVVLFNVRRMDAGDGIAAVNKPYKLINTSVFFCRCVDLDFMYWKLIFPAPRWHLFQHKGLPWWTKPLWWKNTFSLWLLLQMSIHVRDFFLIENYSSSVVCFTSVLDLFRQLISEAVKSVNFTLKFVWVLIFEEAKWWETLSWAEVSELCVCAIVWWLFERTVCLVIGQW